MKIYLLCRNVDLGYHVIFSYKDRQKCQKMLDALIKKHYDEGWGYDPQLFIEETELK